MRLNGDKEIEIEIKKRAKVRKTKERIGRKR